MHATPMPARPMPLRPMPGAPEARVWLAEALGVLEELEPATASEAAFRTRVLELAYELDGPLLGGPPSRSLSAGLIKTFLCFAPALVQPPAPEASGDAVLAGEEVEAFETLGRLRGLIDGLEPAGLAGEWWRRFVGVLLDAVDVFLCLGGDESTRHCLALLDAALDFLEAAVEVAA